MNRWTYDLTGDTHEIRNKCELNRHINQWAKHHLVLSVADIAEDLILGTPFQDTINIFNDDWIHHRIQYHTGAGTTHTWYGIGIPLAV